ncbi:MAG: hypothetical protein KDD53_08990, partial [Bdellovibrionales bacterium]|nr:hypothetical protein [Bdellovibrionales bacterium]
MTERLSWSRIKSLYRGQWVELIDFEWDWESHYPAWACVRHHHYDRNELLRLIEQSPAKKETVLLYLG